MPHPLIFCAIDTDDLDHAIALAKAIGPVTAGASHLVIGRHITRADDPAKAAQDILDRIS